MTQREQHLIKEQEAKENVKSFFLQWKEAIDRIKLNGYRDEKEGSEED